MCQFYNSVFVRVLFVQHSVLPGKQKNKTKTSGNFIYLFCSINQILKIRFMFFHLLLERRNQINSKHSLHSFTGQAVMENGRMDFVFVSLLIEFCLFPFK